MAWRDGVLHFTFPAASGPSVQDLARERENPVLLLELRSRLPELQRIQLAFEEARAEPPESRLRREPALQELLRLTGGEIVEIRKDVLSPS